MKRETLIIAPEHLPLGAIEAPVLRVFDGDCFMTRIRSCEFSGDLANKTEVEVPVRLGFVDAPEIGQPGGPEAKEFLEALIGGRTLRIVVLTKMDTGRSVDRHGRVVAVPYLTETYSDWAFATQSGERHRACSFAPAITISRNVELEMVLNGHAWVLERFGPDPIYMQALEDAQRNRRGIWARSDNVPPWAFKGKSRARQPGRQADLFDREERCPETGCDGTIGVRSGRFGPFLGCSNFPGCRYSRSISA